MATSDDYLFQCAICGLVEGDATNLTTQSSLQVNATIGCGHALYVSVFSFLFQKKIFYFFHFTPHVTHHSFYYLQKQTINFFLSYKKVVPLV